jgi:hypothetical protein
MDCPILEARIISCHEDLILAIYFRDALSDAMKRPTSLSRDPLYSKTLRPVDNFVTKRIPTSGDYVVGSTTTKIKCRLKRIYILLQDALGSVKLLRGRTGAMPK